MRQLMLLRHADSDRPDGVSDRDRPLSPRGRDEIAHVAPYLLQKGTPDLVIVSTASRAQQTWALVQGALPTAVLRQDEPRVYNATTQTLLTLLAETAAGIGSILLVGHDPGLHQLAIELIAGDDTEAWMRLQQKLPTAGLVKMQFEVDAWEGLDPGRGRLMDFVTPKRPTAIDLSPR